MQSIVVAMALIAATPKTDTCQSATDGAALAFKARAEKLFLAYTEQRIAHYVVLGPSRCSDSRVAVVVDGTGPDAKVGASWIITLYEDDGHVVIFPGE